MSISTLRTRVAALRKLVNLYARPDQIALLADQIALLADLTEQLAAAEALEEPLFRKTQ